MRFSIPIKLTSTLLKLCFNTVEITKKFKRVLLVLLLLLLLLLLLITGENYRPGRGCSKDG